MARRRYPWTVLALGAILADLSVIVLTATACGVLYYILAFGSPGKVGDHLAWAQPFGLVFVAITFARSGYRYKKYVDVRRHFDSLWLDWNITVATVIALMFVMKTGAETSRAAIILLYAVGFVALSLLRLGMIRTFQRMVQVGSLKATRQLVIGYGADVDGYAARCRATNDGGTELDTLALEEDAPLDQSFVTKVRALRPDEIVLAVPWSETQLIARLTDALMATPAAINLAPERFLDLYDGGGIPMQADPVTLVRAPLACPDLVLKRFFDIIVAGTGLLLVAPIFLIVAVLIKLDSRGPVFFRQTRHGFNNETFRVFKFRTMTSAENGAAFRQAVRGDARITRIGRLLRRSSIDELPQLLNVLMGDMSIVGPRPHPVALNESFDGRVARYARRHIVKPGITGWAQIHGLRGETHTDGKMQARVAHDLYYLDNWSLGLDIRILLRTTLFVWTSKDAF